jgi:hypothetical protein
MKKILIVILLLFPMVAFAEEKVGPVFKKDGSILNPPKVKIRVIAQGDKSINQAVDLIEHIDFNPT